MSTINEILNTLPVGYYLGHRFEIALERTDKSYIDYETNTIRISEDELKRQLKLIEDVDKESALRTAFYHLLSHVMLTPENTFAKKGYVHTFEDERVESLLGNYFMGVDFKARVQRQSKEQLAKFDGLWYSIVRLRQGPTQFVNKVHEIIKKYPDILTKKYNFDSYIAEVEALYQAAYRYWKDTYKPILTYNESGAYISSEVKLDDEAIDRIMNDVEGNKIATSVSPKSNKASNNEGLSSKNIQALKKYIKSKCKAAGIDLGNEGHSEVVRIQKSSMTLYDKLRYFIDRPLHKISNSSGATASYSGTFNYRNCVREDCRYFSYPNPRGTAKKYKTKHLNLFLDCSGSFEGSDQVNAILAILKKIEGRYPDFSYSVIMISETEKIMPRNNRWHYSGLTGWGTTLSQSIFRTFDTVQQRQAQNFNIVMYDGYVHATHNGAKHKSNLEAFNSSNTVLIVEPSNSLQVRTHCRRAHIIESTDYVNEIEANVVRAFSTFFS